MRAALALPVGALASGALGWLGLVVLDGTRRMGWIAIGEDWRVLPFIACAAALGAAVSTVWTGWRSRKAVRSSALALMLDRLAKMDLGYATAVETAERPHGPVGHALMLDMRGRVADLSLIDLLPLWAKWLRNILIAGLVAGAAALALEVMLPPLQDPAAPVVEVPSADETRQQGRDLAEWLEREAALRQDPMLSAIARAIEERVVNAAPDALAEDLDEELKALADQARASFGENIPAWLEHRRIRPNATDTPIGGAGSGKPDPKAQGDDIFAISMEDIESARRAQAAMLAAEREETGNGRETPASGTGGSDKPAGFGTTPEKIDPAQLHSAGHASVGASADSGKGPGDQAGAGSRALEGEGLVDGKAGEKPMTLPQTAQESGRRIRLTLPPVEAQGGPSNWSGAQAARATRGHAVERSALPAGRRVIVGRFFERAAE